MKARNKKVCQLVFSQEEKEMVFKCRDLMAEITATMINQNCDQYLSNSEDTKHLSYNYFMAACSYFSSFAALFEDAPNSEKTILEIE